MSPHPAFWSLCCVGLIAFGAGCAGSAPVPEDAASAEPSTTEPVTASEARDPEPELEEEASPTDLDEGVDLLDEDPDEDPNRQREIVYKSSPDGLVIETEGLRLVPTVKPIRT